ATKGYPPSCFAKLPQLVERSGNGISGSGSITAIYTVLTEGDDPQDPIADAARGILDGHIVLSRELAEAGHYPAIDVERSISRVMTNVSPVPHVEAARRFRQLHSKHHKAQDLIQLGAYASGHDAELDSAVRLHAPMTQFLQQDMHQPASLADSVQWLQTVMSS
ncbi:MAG: flagellum-specific ATP synthase FliI, partial [Pseudomonadota bacterium]|nr:flagellum-specific ATP synthase FliI [Pseudomonadota bacterium]